MSASSHCHFFFFFFAVSESFQVEQVGFFNSRKNGFFRPVLFIYVLEVSLLQCVHGAELCACARVHACVGVCDPFCAINHLKRRRRLSNPESASGSALAGRQHAAHTH